MKFMTLGQLALLGAGLTLVGCGDDKDDTSTGDTGEPTETNGDDTDTDHRPGNTETQLASFEQQRAILEKKLEEVFEPSCHQ